MSYCYEKIITISPKLATLASGQILTHFLMIHRYTHTHTHTHTHRHTHTQTQGVPIYMEDFILPCNKKTVFIEISMECGRFCLQSVQRVVEVPRSNETLTNGVCRNDTDAINVQFFGKSWIFGMHFKRDDKKYSVVEMGLAFTISRDIFPDAKDLNKTGDAYMYFIFSVSRSLSDNPLYPWYKCCQCFDAHQCNG